MQYHPQTHCWESGEYLGYPGHTCLGLAGHNDRHEWVPNNRIVEYFRKENGDESSSG